VKTEGILSELLSHGEALAFWGVGGSAGLLVLGLFMGPFVLSRLPEDYFSESAPLSIPVRGPRGLLWSIVRNVLGVLLVCAGVLMLVLPGQGFLTILAGLLLMKFPGKRRLMRRAFQFARVRRTLNWVRRRFRKAPFVD
jgi:hypothetical protein